MLLFKPQTDRKICYFCRKFFTFWLQKITALSTSHRKH